MNLDVSRFRPSYTTNLSFTSCIIGERPRPAHLPLKTISEYTVNSKQIIYFVFNNQTDGVVALHRAASSLSIFSDFY